MEEARGGGLRETQENLGKGKRVRNFGGLACLLRGRSSRAIVTEVNEDL